MKPATRRLGAFVLAFVLALLSACSNPSQQGSGEPTSGGTLIFGAEQFPLCLNPVTSCYNASWLHYIALLPTLPQLLTLDDDNGYVASPLVQEVPTVENGGVTQNPFTVTYKLNPKAVWEDGSPITGEDVKFTWLAYRDSPKSIFRKSGYDKITDVRIEGDVASGQKVTIVFSEPYAPWKDKFGGGGEYVLKADAFNGNPDVSDKMAQDVGFSGGPFKILTFSASELVLVRNNKFWGRPAYLDKVVFPSVGADSEVSALRTGEIHAFYPQPTEQLQQIKQIPGGRIKPKAGTVFEGLWFNLDQFPVNQREVREALLYGLDRQVAIDAVAGPLDPSIEVNRCLWNQPALDDGKWCNNDFYMGVGRAGKDDREKSGRAERFEQDQRRARMALESAGWVLGADKIYAKDGKRLTIPLATTAKNPGREQFQQIVIDQAKAIGVEITADNADPTTLFQTRLPSRQFVSALFAQVATPDPSVTASLAKDQIPTPESSAGQNYYGWRDDAATELMKRSDVEVDEATRIEQFKQIGQAMARDVIGIPLFPKPQILVWNENRVGGVKDFNAGQVAFAHNLAEWYLK
jgi:peptide/nickel transport system substrate-binding protein